MDVDHTGKRVGAVGGGVRPANHFDTNDVFDSEWQRFPGYAAVQRHVGRASVDQYLHSAGELLGQSMIGHHRSIAGKVADLEARQDTKEFGHVARADGSYGLFVEYREGHR